jgi:dihydrofolate reductase
MTQVTLIAAVGRNGVIGAGNDMPWHLPEDFAFFKRTTMGHPMVMGRKTFDSIGRVLPGRRTIVVTRQPDWRHAGVETAHSLSEALSLAGPADEVFVCGGGQVYAEAMPWAHRLLITEVEQAPDGDVRFPPIDPATWREASREDRDGFSWVTYERVRP